MSVCDTRHRLHSMLNPLATQTLTLHKQAIFPAVIHHPRTLAQSGSRSIALAASSTASSKRPRARYAAERLLNRALSVLSPAIACVHKLPRFSLEEPTQMTDTPTKQHATGAVAYPHHQQAATNKGPVTVLPVEPSRPCRHSGSRLMLPDNIERPLRAIPHDTTQPPCSRRGRDPESSSSLEVRGERLERVLQRTWQYMRTASW